MGKSSGQSSGEAISQADIDALLGSAGQASPAPPSGGDAGAISQSDIDALMAATGGEESPPESSGGVGPSPPDTRLDSLGRPFDEVAAAMQAAIEEERAANSAAGGPAFAASVRSPELPDFTRFSAAGVDPKRVTMLKDVSLNVKIELGRTRMRVEDVLKLDDGSVVELDRLAGDPVDVFANERLIARGEVLVLNDAFCVRISEVFSHDPHRITQ